MKIVALVISVLLTSQVNALDMQKAMRTSLTFESGYANAFPDIQTYLMKEQAYGFIDGAQRAELEKFIKQHGVSLQARVPAAEVKDGKLNWGHYQLEVQSTGDVKLQNGRIIHRKGQKDFYAIFMQTFKDLTDRHVAFHSRSWLIETADAGTVADAIDNASEKAGHAAHATDEAIEAVGAGLSVAGSWALWSAGQAVKTVGDIGTTVIEIPCGVVAMTAEFARYNIAWSIYNERIECNHDEYVQLKYPPFLKTVAADMDSSIRRIKEVRSVPKPFHEPFFGSMKSFCFNPVADLFGTRFENYRSTHGWDPDSKAEDIKKELTSEFLKKAFKIGSGPVPKCDEAHRKELEAYIRENSIKAEDTIARAFDGSRIGNEGGSGTKATH